MRRSITVASIAALTMVLASCGDDETSDTAAPTTASSTSVVATTVPSSTGLEVQLLTEDEISSIVGVEPDWTVEPIDYAEGLSGYLDLSCDEVTLDPLIVERLTADVGIDAGLENGDAFLLEFIVQGEAAQLDADIEAFRSASAICDGSTTGSGAPVAAQELDLPALGDQQWAAIGVCEGWSAQSRSYFAQVRVGRTVVIMGVCEEPVASIGNVLPVTDDEFVQLLEAAVAKVQD